MALSSGKPWGVYRGNQLQIGSETVRPINRTEIRLMARSLDRFRISRELRTPGLVLGDVPDDTGVYVLEHVRSA